MPAKILDKETRERLAKLIPLLASDKDGEVLAAAAAVQRTLVATGADFHDLAEALSAETVPRARAHRSAASSKTKPATTDPFTTYTSNRTWQSCWNVAAAWGTIDIYNICQYCQYWLELKTNPWETDFLSSLLNFRHFSEKQRAQLSFLANKARVQETLYRVMNPS